MDNSPAWDEPLAATPTETHLHLERRDTKTVAAAQRPTTIEYEHYLGIVAVLRAAGWDTESQPAVSPFVVEDPGFTALAVRAADDLHAVARALGTVGAGADLERVAAQLRVGLEALWDDDVAAYRAFDVHRGRAVGPATAGGLLALWAGCRDDRALVVRDRVRAWTDGRAAGVPTTDPDAAGFDPVRYWRGPVWVLVNWLVAEGARRSGDAALAELLRAGTHALVERSGFAEYYDPRDGAGIGGSGFSWSAALTLWWAVRDGSQGEPRSSSFGSAGVTTRDDGPAAK
jgi:glycogen debranching enzyme